MDGIFMRRCDTKKVNLRKKNLKGDGGQGCSHASVEWGGTLHGEHPAENGEGRSGFGALLLTNSQRVQGIAGNNTGNASESTGDELPSPAARHKLRPEIHVDIFLLRISILLRKKRFIFICKDSMPLTCPRDLIVYVYNFPSKKRIGILSFFGDEKRETRALIVFSRRRKIKDWERAPSFSYDLTQPTPATFTSLFLPFLCLLFFFLSHVQLLIKKEKCIILWW